MNVYDLGDPVPLSFTSSNASGFYDPEAVYLVIRDPDGVESDVSADVSHDGVGHYSYTFEPSQPDQWWYRWSTAGGPDAEEASFLVLRPHVTSPP